MYFHQGENVACRLCLPHPLAFVKDNRKLRFAPTIDVNFVANFSPRETHLAISPDDVAMIELSPRDKEFVETEPMIKRLENNLPSCPAFVRMTNPRHRQFFQRRITITGNAAECGDEAVVKHLLGGGNEE
jgi:hypothetical protein